MIPERMKDKGTGLNDFQLTEHFNLSEFECPCCHCVKLHPDVVIALQTLRRRIGNRPIIVTSGYRCPRHNAVIGGANASDHLYGWAADIIVSGMPPEELAGAAESLPELIKRIGTYSNRPCVHIGVVHRDGFPSRWGPVFSSGDEDGH